MHRDLSMMRGKPLYDADRVHVVHYTKGSESRRITGRMSFNQLRKLVRERHGKEAAATCVSWGWQIPPID